MRPARAVRKGQHVGTGGGGQVGRRQNGRSRPWGVGEAVSRRREARARSAPGALESVPLGGFALHHRRFSVFERDKRPPSMRRKKAPLRRVALIGGTANKFCVGGLEQVSSRWHLYSRRSRDSLERFLGSAGARAPVSTRAGLASLRVSAPPRAPASASRLAPAPSHTQPDAHTPCRVRNATRHTTTHQRRSKPHLTRELTVQRARHGHSK